MGRDVPSITVTQQDRRAYREKVRQCLDVFARMLRESRFETEPRQVGLEIELNLVDPDGMPSMSNLAALEAIADPNWASELGRFNLEINVPPRQLTGDALTLLEDDVGSKLAVAAARTEATGSRLVMIGILPTLRQADVTDDAMSANPRYRLLNEQMIAARGEDMRICIDGPERLLTHVDTIMPEAACTSVQFHLQVSPEAFGSYWNAAQAVAGIQVALAANSPFLFGRELWRETRIPLFEQVTDTRPEELQQQGVRPRVWFGERWITSVFDLFEENLRYFPALLPLREDEDPAAALDSGRAPRLAELTLHNGTVYRWNRPVYAVEDRAAAPAGGEPGTARWADGRRRRRKCGLLLRASPGARRDRAPGMDADVVRSGCRQSGRGRAPWHRREGLLAGYRRGAGHRAHAAAAAAAGLRGLAAVGSGRQGRRPDARHHRAALPDRPHGRDLAGRGGAAAGARPGGPARGAAPDDPGLYRADGVEPASAFLAEPVTGSA